MAVISQEQFDTWSADPVTRALREHLRSARETAKEQWATGGLVCETEFQTIVQQARVLGRIELANELLDLTPDDFQRHEE